MVRSLVVSFLKPKRGFFFTLVPLLSWLSLSVLTAVPSFRPSCYPCTSATPHGLRLRSALVVNLLLPVTASNIVKTLAGLVVVPFSLAVGEKEINSEHHAAVRDLGAEALPGDGRGLRQTLVMPLS